MFSCKKFCKPGQILSTKIIFAQRNSFCHSLSLWLNSPIRVNNKPIHYLSWSSQGIQNISHLTENETRFLSFSEFKERYNVKINFLSFCGVISAVKHLVVTFTEKSLRKASTTIFFFFFLVARLYLWTCRIQETHPTIDTFPLFLSQYNP